MVKMFFDRTTFLLGMQIVSTYHALIIPRSYTTYLSNHPSKSSPCLATTIIKSPLTGYNNKCVSPIDSIKSTTTASDNVAFTNDKDNDDVVKTLDNNNDEKKTPLSMTLDELSHSLRGRGRAKAAWDCYRLGVDPIKYYSSSSAASSPDDDDDIIDLLPVKRRTEGLGKASVELLSELGGSIEGVISEIAEVKRSADSTTKLLMRLLKDGLEVETVIIPMTEKRDKSTLCISSQVGCRQGCTFCATGRMGRLRSLTSDEILSQLFFANRICRLENLPPIDNIVFMGMGEPADNPAAVLRSAKILTDRNLFSLAQSKVTISTVGISPSSFATLATAPCVLAWSVHAARDDLRRELVPTTKYSMTELREGFSSALNARSKRLRTTMLEVVLVDGVNDGEREAWELVDFVKGLVDDTEGAKVVVNLIPFNDIGHPSYGRPSRERVLRFQSILVKEGILTYQRATRGDDKMAACGQLATKRKKEKDQGVMLGALKD